jgi:hypothetical protein
MVCSGAYPFQIREQGSGVLSVVFELALGVWFYAHCFGFYLSYNDYCTDALYNWTLVDTALPGDPGLLYS